MCGSLIFCRAKTLGIHTHNRIHKMGEVAAPLRKPSQRHSTLLGMDAHHVLRALNPNTSHLRATATSLPDCIQLQQRHTELAANQASELATDRARGRARADAQPQKKRNIVRERLRISSRRQSAGGVETEREQESRGHRRQSAGDV